MATASIHDQVLQWCTKGTELAKLLTAVALDVALASGEEALGLPELTWLINAYYGVCTGFWATSALWLGPWPAKDLIGVRTTIRRLTGDTVAGAIQGLTPCGADEVCRTIINKHQVALNVREVCCLHFVSATCFIILRIMDYCKFTIASS